MHFPSLGTWKKSRHTSTIEDADDSAFSRKALYVELDSPCHVAASLVPVPGHHERDLICVTSSGGRRLNARSASESACAIRVLLLPLDVKRAEAGLPFLARPCGPGRGTGPRPPRPVVRQGRPPTRRRSPLLQLSEPQRDMNHPAWLSREMCRASGIVQLPGRHGQAPERRPSRDEPTASISERSDASGGRQPTAPFHFRSRRMVHDAGETHVAATPSHETVGSRPPLARGPADLRPLRG